MVLNYWLLTQVHIPGMRIDVSSGADSAAEVIADTGGR